MTTVSPIVSRGMTQLCRLAMWNSGKLIRNRRGGVRTGMPNASASAAPAASV